MDQGRLPHGMTIRPIRIDDLLPLERFYAGLSPDSIDARFHGAMRGIPDRTARSFCRPDHVHREGLVAVARGGDGGELVVGHLCLEPIGSEDLEMAIVVADAWQHQGIGHALLSAAMDWAVGHGIARVHGVIRWSNPAILGLLRTCGRPARIVTDAEGETRAMIDIASDLRVAA